MGERFNDKEKGKLVSQRICPRMILMENRGRNFINLNLLKQCFLLIKAVVQQLQVPYQLHFLHTS